MNGLIELSSKQRICAESLGAESDSEQITGFAKKLRRPRLDQCRVDPRSDTGDSYLEGQKFPNNFIGSANERLFDQHTDRGLEYGEDFAASSVDATAGSPRHRNKGEERLGAASSYVPASPGGVSRLLEVAYALGVLAEVDASSSTLDALGPALRRTFNAQQGSRSTSPTNGREAVVR